MLALMAAFWGVAGPVEGIGLEGHMVVVEMATQDIDKTSYPDLVNILRDYLSERDSGSLLPDWAWVSPYQEYSVIAHSVEFHKAWADYVKLNFAPSFSLHEKREVSFLLGLTAHTYSDPPWHIYFLPEAKTQDNAGELLAEYGTDILANWELGKWDDVMSGYCPAVTAVRVYATMGYPDVTEAMVVKGMLMLRAGYWLEKIMGYRVYLSLVKRIPWIDANYLSYVPGGLEYDAGVSAPEMVSTWDYIQDRSVQLMPDNVPVFRENGTFLSLGQRLLESGSIRIPLTRTPEGEYFFGEPQTANPDRLLEILKGLL